ncbi:MAG: hypothetical protein PUE07_05145 [bacterium]|nr:hypothetical protein [bacterium]
MKKGAKKYLFLFLIAFWISYIAGFIIDCILKRGFDIRYLFGKETLGLFALFFLGFLAVVLLYYYRHY